MKKHAARVISIILIMAFMVSLSACSVKIGDGEIIAVFKYSDANIRKPLSNEDCETVKEIFDGKYLSFDLPSCGFSEDVALLIDGNTYCIACDMCGIIFVKNRLQYISLSDKENETLHDLLSEYGFKFPCI